MQQRVELLIERKKEGKITAAEAEEMERYFTLKHIVRLAKARALKIVKINSRNESPYSPSPSRA